MSIRLRFTLLLSLLLAGFLGALLVLHQLERSERAEMLESDRQARTQLLNHWLEATGRELPQYAADLARSDEFAAALAESDTEAVRQRLGASLAEAGLAGLWIVRADGSVRLQAAAPAQELPAETPLAPAVLAEVLAETPQPRFFSLAGSRLLELAARRLQSSSTPEWVLVARAWGGPQLAALESLTEGSVTLLPGHQQALPSAASDRLVLLRPLPDAQGRPIRILRLEYTAPGIESALRADWRQAMVFIAYGLLVLVAMILALRTWVLRPLGQLQDSLATNRAEPAAPLAREPHEFGRLATLLLSSFAQREALQREIEERTRAEAALSRSEAALRENLEERARLGRDLHDGVIQSLYAAGMGLASIRGQLRPEQTEAAARLEQTRGALNETIHDVRNFIVGLEPEALKRQSFSQAVSALMDTLKGMREFRGTLDIDDGLAERLSLAQRVHALQITREALSNALRHGEAGNLHVALRARNEFAEFEVTDDGQGFDPAVGISPGRGLDNFAQRARELGADLEVHSRPGEGTRVRLSFSLPSYD